MNLWGGGLRRLSLKSISVNKNIIKSAIITVSAIVVISFLYQKSGLYYRKPIFRPVFLQQLNRYDLVMAKGEEYKLYIYNINKRVLWSTTDFRVAFVNFNGRVYALQHGEAFIIAKVGDREYKCRVNVIDLNKDKLTLRAGDTYHLRVLGRSLFASYKSSNKAVARVSLSGRVKAERKGNAVITVRVKGKSLKCRVTVK